MVSSGMKTGDGFSVLPPVVTSLFRPGVGISYGLL